MGRWEGSEQCLVGGSGCEVDRGNARCEGIVKKYAGFEGASITQSFFFFFTIFSSLYVLTCAIAFSPGR